MNYESDSSDDASHNSDPVSPEGQQDCVMLCDEVPAAGDLYVSMLTKEDFAAQWNAKEEQRRQENYAYIKVLARRALTEAATREEEEISLDTVVELTDQQVQLMLDQQKLTLKLCQGRVEWSTCVWGLFSGAFDDMVRTVTEPLECAVSIDRCSDYYIGLAWSPARRWLGKAYFPELDYDGHRFEYDEMLVLAFADTRFIGLLEKIYVDRYRNKDPRCRNRAPGGGHRGKDGTMSALYVARNFQLPL